MGSVEWMFLFRYGGNFVFDCCLYLSFSGLIPVGLDREMPLYVFACECVSICVCVRQRERETDGGIYPSSFLQLQLSGLAVIHKATLHK